MDNYERMCEAARLEWEPRVGDRFVVKNALYVTSTKEDDLIFTTRKQKYQRPYYEEGVEYVVGEEGFGAVLSYGTWVYLAESLKSFTIWLPSVEQICEMFFEKLNSLEPFVQGFFIFVMKREFGSLIKHHSYRELHLIYYCYYFENRLWDGENFVEIEEPIGKRWGG